MRANIGLYVISGYEHFFEVPALINTALTLYHDTSVILFLLSQFLQIAGSAVAKLYPFGKKEQED